MKQKATNVLNQCVAFLSANPLTKNIFKQVPEKWQIPSIVVTFCVLVIMVVGICVMIFSPKNHWNGDWSTHKKITIDIKSAGIGEDVGTVPVLIRLRDGNFQFDAAKPDGSDLHFVADDNKTELAFHVEKMDSMMGEAFVWVKVANIKPGLKTNFGMYYGGNKSEKLEDAKNTYDADTVLVYHFAEHGQPPVDSSASGNTASNAGVAIDGSMIGSGIRLDGATAITIPAVPSLMWQDGAPMTWMAWVKFVAPQSSAVVFSRREGAMAFLVGVDNGVPYVEVTNAVGTLRSQAQASNPMPANSWHHIAVVSEGAAIKLYLDGEVYATLAGTLPALNAPSMIGGNASAGETGFSGEMDELSIHKIARTAAFIKMSALGQGGDKVVVYGTDEGGGGGHGGYIGILFSAVTIDGWIIIFLLAIMSILSWVLMVKKYNYLESLGKGNTLFMEEWHRVADDIMIHGGNDLDRIKNFGGRVKDETAWGHIRAACLYRIFDVGIEEIRQRLLRKNGKGSSQIFTDQAIKAIRATMDTSVIRESQELNKWMVILTICISGGPFLGLLGTVVGVMITFAAIAAAGDVNVNAIAPGIAAALVATVAGLLVAIPALFGYNYLLSRIKDTITNMHIFTEEFVSRMAEFYGGAE